MHSEADVTAAGGHEPLDRDELAALVDSASRAAGGDPARARVLVEAFLRGQDAQRQAVEKRLADVEARHAEAIIQLYWIAESYGAILGIRESAAEIAARPAGQLVPFRAVRRPS